MRMPAEHKKVRHRVDHPLAVVLLCQRLSTGIAHFLSTVRGGDVPPGCGLAGVTCCKSGWGSSVKKIYAGLGT